MRMGGELVAICHPQKPTGYKAPNAFGNRVRFDGSTTNGIANKKVAMVGENKNGNKKLMPYHPLAPRNRPKAQVQNITGSRFAVPKGFTEKYRNSSQVQFGDGSQDSQWKTTNQTYSQPTGAATRDSGMDNTGIFAEQAVMTHAKQRF
ncbi:hypothetical protein N9L76_07190 [bacterium]|nr:hypothetical protein [bacterium]